MPGDRASTSTAALPRSDGSGRFTHPLTGSRADDTEERPTVHDRDAVHRQVVDHDGGTALALRATCDRSARTEARLGFASTPAVHATVAPPAERSEVAIWIGEAAG